MRFIHNKPRNYWLSKILTVLTVLVVALALHLQVIFVYLLPKSVFMDGVATAFVFSPLAIVLVFSGMVLVIGWDNILAKNPQFLYLP